LRGANGTGLAVSVLQELFIESGALDEEQFSRLVDGLVKDGLVVREGDSMRLP
jgi:hypothetical protein